jgi:uncharacterized membrane-anchored protein
MSGVEITLKTRPIDPYDILSGYHVVLGYEVEEQAHSALKDLGPGDVVWITLRRAEPAWEFVAASRERPDTGDDMVAVPAHFRERSPRIVGAGRLYVPEVQRKEAEGVARGEALVDARVGTDGTVALLRLRIEGKVFGE